MKTVHPRGRASNSALHLPLFKHAEKVRVRSLPVAAKHLARRHGLTPATALVVAEAAGFFIGEAR